MSETGELYAEQYFEYLRHRSGWRKQVRQLYLRDIRQECTGKTIDLGCGVGELLKWLPEGSIGLEINSFAVRYCQAQGLDVALYDPASDDYRLDGFDQRGFSTLTMNHVLEHLDNPAQVLFKLFESGKRLSIQRFVFTVPGWKGYLSDPTHRTFVDMAYLEEKGLLNHPYYRLIRARYFPFNSSFFSKKLTHNELRITFEYLP
jgi:SAM-dependent methyltransferase